MKKSNITKMPGYYDRYIHLVDDIEILDAFDQSIQQIDHINIDELLQLEDNVYAPEKWTIKQIIQHIIDTERVFTERTTRFARQDGVTPQGFDENLFADNAKVSHRTLESLLKELKSVRIASKAMFEGFDDETIQHSGNNYNTEMSVLAMGFTMVGHQVHHFNIIRERYLPLLEK